MPEVKKSNAERAKLARKILAARGKLPAGLTAEGPLPSRQNIEIIVEDLLEVLFPGALRMGVDVENPMSHMTQVLEELEERLIEGVYLGLHRRCAHKREDACRRKAVKIATSVLHKLPEIRAQLSKDVVASFEGDPAATGFDEIVACYPGLFAITIYRCAHQLLVDGAEIVPRMMTEYAHSRTGIDIHPGAVIGESFFIDHGTGVVIGETSVIGTRVRIYQGVTLGALSIRDRSIAASGQRHPTIEDDVTIYANATILGGKTVIGAGSIIGGNARVTFSVPPGTRVGA